MATDAETCAVCGAELGPGGCESCAAAEQSENTAAGSALWMKLLAAAVYLAVGAGCVYASLGFFDRDQASTTDWIFGVMGFGLAAVALLGVKESFFPSEWKSD